MRPSAEVRNKNERFWHKSAKALAPVMGALALAGASPEKHNPAPPAVEPLAGLDYEINSAPTQFVGFKTETALERSSVDRPDDQSGPQIKVIYALPKDGIDRELDTNGTIEELAWRVRDYQASKAEGLSMRMDTYQNQLDTGFIRLSKSGSELAAQQNYIANTINEELHKNGYTDSADKIHWVLYDGPPSTSVDGLLLCGAASRPPTVPGNVAMININHPACSVSEAGGPFSWLYLASTHEIKHAMGHVSDSSPRYDGTYHSTDPTDIMYGKAQSTLAAAKALLFDPGRDDYWNDSMRRYDDYHNELSLAISDGGSVSAKPTPNPYLSESSCEDDCTMVFRDDEKVSLQASPERFWRLQDQAGNWPRQGELSVEMDTDKRISVVFEPIAELRVRVRKPGHGTVRVIGQGVCRTVCNYELLAGKRATLIAKAAKGFRFGGWAGSPAKSRYTSVFSQGAHSKTAVFVKNTN